MEHSHICGKYSVQWDFVWAITKAERIIKQQISIFNSDKHCVTYHPCFSAEEFPVILVINKSSILSLIY